MRLTRAYRSLPRPSSASKPRYPPSSVGVSGFNQERAQYAPGVRSARVTPDNQGRMSGETTQDAPAKQASTRATVKNRQLTNKTPRTRAAKRQQLRAHERV